MDEISSRINGKEIELRSTPRPRLGQSLQSKESAS